MRWSGSAGRWLTGALLAVAVALPTRAADLDTELDELAAAISARLAVVDSKKEEKKLGKADAKLDGATSENTDGKALSKILSAVFGSRTVDADVIAEAQDVLDCLRQLAADQKTDAEAFLDQLDDKFARKLEKKIASGDKKLEAGIALVAENPKKAAALFKVALGKYVKSRAFAEKTLARQNKVRLGSKPRMVATIEGTGKSVKFSEFANAFGFGNQITIQGCDAQGPDGVCRTVLTFTILYDPGSRATGPVPQTFFYYSESSDFGNGSGPGVQDVTWSGLLTSVEVLENDGKLIKGRFSGTAQADEAQQPLSIEVSGTFVVKRPKDEGF